MWSIVSRITLVTLIFAVFLFGTAFNSSDRAYCENTASAIVPADKPVNDVPLGVYLSWEFTSAYCKYAGMDQWQYVRKIVKSIKEQNIDTLWLVNIQLPDLQKLLKLTIPAGIKVLPCLGEIEPRNHGWKLDVNDPATFAGPLAHYDTEVPAIVKAIGEDKKGIMAWVLGDEPTDANIIMMEHLRKLFREADPEHPVLTVNMWPQIVELPAKTRMTTFCVDLYPFFGHNNPNGPNSPDASRNFYTVNAQNMVEEAGKDGRYAWIMGQSFAEIWGPYISDKRGALTVLPGGFMHWRPPTIPEVRWQVWEALRCGAKGFLFFQLYYIHGETKPSAPAITEANLLPGVVKRKTELGLTTLLDLQAEPTPMLHEVSKTYVKIRPFKKLILSLTPTTIEWIQGNEFLKVGNFTTANPKELYSIVVNRDLEQKKKAKLVVGVTITKITDVLSGKKLKMTPLGWAGGNNAIEVELPAGDGTILKLER